MQRPGKIKDVKKRINVGEKEMLHYGVGNYAWASSVER